MDLSAFLAVLTGLQAGSDLISKIERALRGRLNWDRLWQDTGACFEAALHEEERINLRELPIRELNSVKEAFEELHRSGSTGECSTAAKAVLERDWKITSEVRLGDLAAAYCDCARRALLAQSFKDQPGFLLVASALFDLEKVIRNGANRRATLPVPNYGDNVERFLDFYLREERVFVGRENELSALHQKVTGQEQGFAFVSAPAGKGKSALLSRLWLGIHLSPHPGVKVVFMPISTRFGTATKKAFYERLAHELSAVYDIEKPEAGSEVEALRYYTQNLLSQPPDERLKLVLIVDGLDEATDWDPVKEPPFPLRLGAQARLVLSARTTPDYPDAASWSGALGLPPDQGLFLNLGNLSEADVRRALAEARLPEIAPEDAEVVASELYRLTEEGDPLLLDLYLDALNPEKGGIPKLTVNELKNIAPGYAGYFESWQEALENRLRHQGPGDLRDLAVTVFTLLSYAKGPLSRVDLGAVARFWLEAKKQSDAHFAVRFEKILEHGNRLLAGNDEALSLAHPRLGEFFQQRYGVHEPDFERAYADWGLGAWRKARTTTGGHPVKPLPRYLLEHLSSHLADLGMLNELAELVVDPTWFRQGQAHDATLRLLAQDLNRLLDLAMEQQKRPDIWATDVFFLNKLHANANNLPTAIFGYFGKAGRTSEALGWIELITDEVKRSEALTELISTLPPREISTYTEALIKQAGTLQSVRGTRVLAIIALRLAKVYSSKARNVASIALETVQKIKGERFKTKALAETAWALARANSWRALAAMREITRGRFKAKALAEVAQALAEIDSQEALDVANEALAVARDIRYRRFKAKALAEVAQALAEINPQEALNVANEALGVARGIEYGPDRVKALMDVVKALAGINSEKARGVAREIEYGPDRVKALMDVVKALAGMAPEKVLDVANEALGVARGIWSSSYRAKSLAVVAKELSGVDPEYSTEVAREIEYGPDRTEALAVVARALAGVNPETAIGVTEDIKYNVNKVKIIIEVTEELAGKDPKKALEVAQEIEYGPDRAEALAGVARALAKINAEQAQVVAGEALEVVRGIEDGWARAYALAGVARALAGVDGERALEVARGIGVDWAKAEALAEAARALAEINSQEALNVANEALEAAQRIEWDRDRAGSLAGVARALAKINAEQAQVVAGEALEVARGIKWDRPRIEALAEAARALAGVDAERAQRAFVEAAKAARASGMTWEWIKEAYPTLAAVAPEKVAQSYDRLKNIHKLFEGL